MNSLNSVITGIAIVSIFMLSGCSVVEGIFKVGFWAGIIVVGLIVALVIWIFKKLS